MAGPLLIGGNGQVGREIALRAERNETPLTVTARDTLDITDGDAIERAFDAFQPDLVINASAYTAVDRAESEPETAFTVNRDGPAALARNCARHGVPLIHISTDYVYDGSKPSAYVETDPVAPLGVYGASKLAGEDAIRENLARHIIMRTAWVYGVHGHNFVKTMLRLGRERDTLKVVDDQHGTPTHAAELADAILELAERIEAGSVEGNGWGTFHCAGQGETTWCGFAREIFAVAEQDLGRKVRVDAITTAEFPTPAERPGNSRLDCSLLRAVHGIELRPWQEGLRAMMDGLDRQSEK